MNKISTTNLRDRGVTKSNKVTPPTVAPILQSKKLNSEAIQQTRRVFHGVDCALKIYCVEQ